MSKFLKTIKRLSRISQPRPSTKLRNEAILARVADSYTPEKLKLKEDLTGVFLKKHFNVGSYELFPGDCSGGSNGLSEFYYVKRGTLRIMIESENNLYECTLPQNSYALIPRGNHTEINIGKELNSLYGYVTSRPTVLNGTMVGSWDEWSNEAEKQIAEVAKVFAKKFPTSQHIIPTLVKSGTLPGIDAVTK